MKDFIEKLKTDFTDLYKKEFDLWYKLVYVKNNWYGVYPEIETLEEKEIYNIFYMWLKGRKVEKEQLINSIDAPINDKQIIYYGFKRLHDT